MCASAAFSILCSEACESAYLGVAGKVKLCTEAMQSKRGDHVFAPEEFYDRRPVPSRQVLTPHSRPIAAACKLR